MNRKREKEKLREKIIDCLIKLYSLMEIDRGYEGSVTVNNINYPFYETRTTVDNSISMMKKFPIDEVPLNLPIVLNIANKIWKQVKEERIRV